MQAVMTLLRANISTIVYLLVVCDMHDLQVVVLRMSELTLQSKLYIYVLLRHVA